MNGYTYSQTILNKEKTNGTLSSFSTDYPVFYYALNYGTASVGGTQYAAPTATNNSGWYLPSVGQWYLIVKNLGGITRVMDVDNGYNGYWSNPAAFNAASTINGILNNVVGSGSISNSTYYWCSSEYASNSACYVEFNTSGNLFLNSNSKTDIRSGLRVRSIIAF